MKQKTRTVQWSNSVRQVKSNEMVSVKPAKSMWPAPKKKKLDLQNVASLVKKFNANNIVKEMDTHIDSIHFIAATQNHDNFYYYFFYMP